MSDGGLAAWLRDARRSAGLTQAELSVRSGVAVRTIRELESGRIARPRSETVRSLRGALADGEEDAERPATAGPGPLIRVLGHLELHRDGGRVEVGGVERRALLGYLAVRAGRAVAAEELLDAVWADRPGATRSALQTQVSRLRRLLADVRGSHDSPALEYAEGYRLVVDDAQVDLLALRAARRAVSDGADDEHAFHALEEVVATVSGPVLGDLPQFAEDAVVVAANEEVRQAILRFGELAVRTGRPASAIGPLRSIMRTNPLDELACARLMTALVHAGRQAEALREFHAVRERLVDELGVDPGKDLAAAFEQVLAGDTVTVAVEGEQVPRPAELPAAPTDFTGRVEQVERLRQMLVAEPGTGPPVVSVTGIGGAGKTTLATHVAHLVRDAFPDGQLFVDLHGVGDQPLAPADVLARFLGSLHAAEVPAGLDDRAALYRSLLHERRMLVLLDNAADVRQVTPLIPGTPGNAVLITSRHESAAPPSASQLRLDTLAREDSHALLRRIVGADRVDAEPEETRAVLRACADLPLAIRVAGTRLATRPRWTVRDLADRLSDGRRRLDELSLSVSVRASFQLSYDMLDEDAATVFRVLGSWPVPEIASTTVAAMLDLSPNEAERALDRLVDVSLLEATTPGRYRLHDLLYDYAVDLYRQQGTGHDMSAGERRTLAFLVVTARSALSALFPGHRQPAPGAAEFPGAGLAFSGYADAYAWFATELGALRVLVRRAEEGAGADPDAAGWLAVALIYYLGLTGEHPAAEEVSRCGIALRDRVRSPALAAHLLLARSRHLAQSARPDEARALLERALEEFQALDDALWEAVVTQRLGNVDLWTGRFADAEARYVEALELEKKIDRAHGTASVLLGLAQAAYYQGRSVDAERYARDLVTVTETNRDVSNEAVGWGALAQALVDQGRYAEGVEAGQQALAKSRAAGDSFNEPAHLDILAEAHRHSGDLDAALAHGLLALHKCADRPVSMSTAEILTGLGRTLHALGRDDEAALRWTTALEQYEQLGHQEADRVRELLASLEIEPG